MATEHHVWLAITIVASPMVWMTITRGESNLAVTRWADMVNVVAKLLPTELS
jgi:hypothetical protein